MATFYPRYRAAAAASFILLFVASCSSSIAPYSETAYTRAVSLKVESLRLMSQAGHPYEDFAGKVRNLQIELDKTYEFARGRPRNEHSTRQWEILLDRERNLLGGFLRRWEESVALTWPFIEEAKVLVADAFDTIIGLESGKIKAGKHV
jgi:hypothetical protein